MFIKCFEDAKEVLFILECAEYFVKNKSTLRKTAKAKGISKSCVHKYFTDYLPLITDSLYLEVKALLFKNWEEKHIRGGNATRKKYKGV